MCLVNKTKGIEYIETPCLLSLYYYFVFFIPY